MSNVCKLGWDGGAKHLTGFNCFFYVKECIYLLNNLYLFKTDMKTEAWEMKLYKADDLMKARATTTMVLPKTTQITKLFSHFKTEHMNLH